MDFWSPVNLLVSPVLREKNILKNNLYEFWKKTGIIYYSFSIEVLTCHAFNSLLTPFTYCSHRCLFLS